MTTIAKHLTQDVLAGLISAGRTSAEIAEQYDCSPNTVLRRCVKYALPPPARGSKAIFTKDTLAALITAGLTAEQIVKRYGCEISTIYKTCARLGLPNPVVPEHHRTRIKQFNTRFFAELNSEDRAWCLGFIASDGGRDRQWGIRVTIRDRDIDVLHKMAGALQCSYAPRPVCNTNMVTLGLYDIDLVKDLEKYGIVERKTYSLPFAQCVPPQLIVHYMRGMWDGDGSIGTRQFRLVTGSKTFFDGFVQWYKDNYQLTPWTQCEGGTKWRIVFCKRDTQFIRDMYEHASIVSDRRMLAYKTYWSNNDMVRSYGKP